MVARGRKRYRCIKEMSGFTYLGVLLAVAVLGIGLSAASEVWVTTASHQKMVQAEWVGLQITQAIGSYYEATPGARKTFPPDLNALLEDRRHSPIRRHLRSLYPNPFSGKRDWEPVLSPEGGVRGVRVRWVTGGNEVRLKEFAFTPVGGVSLPRIGVMSREPEGFAFTQRGI